MFVAACSTRPHGDSFGPLGAVRLLLGLLLLEPFGDLQEAALGLLDPLGGVLAVHQEVLTAPRKKAESGPTTAPPYPWHGAGSDPYEEYA